jgi:hypothetical protein
MTDVPSRPAHVVPLVFHAPTFRAQGESTFEKHLDPKSELYQHISCIRLRVTTLCGEAIVPIKPTVAVRICTRGATEEIVQALSDQLRTGCGVDMYDPARYSFVRQKNLVFRINGESQISLVTFKNPVSDVTPYLNLAVEQWTGTSVMKAVQTAVAALPVCPLRHGVRTRPLLSSKPALPVSPVSTQTRVPLASIEQRRRDNDLAEELLMEEMREEIARRDAMSEE